MKILWQMFEPTIKAIIGVFSILFTAISLSYGGMVLIARTEARSIEEKIVAVRAADVYYITQRFDNIDIKLDTIYRESKK